MGKNFNETTSNLVRLASEDITFFKIEFQQSQHFFKMRRKKHKLVKRHFGMILDNLIEERYRSYEKGKDYYAYSK
jgi:hypothetical protein